MSTVLHFKGNGREGLELGCVAKAVSECRSSSCTFLLGEDFSPFFAEVGLKHLSHGAGDT